MMGAMGLPLSNAQIGGRGLRKSFAASWLAVLALSLTATSLAAEPVPVNLRRPTLDAFDRYVAVTDAQNDEALRSTNVFLWVDALPEARRSEAYAAMKRGDVVIDKRETRDSGKSIHCPGGLIHHWVGSVFIPGATLAQTLTLVEDYDHHTQVYAPYELRSQVLERGSDHFKVSFRYLRKKIITVVLDAIFDIDYHTVDATHAWSRGRTVSVRQIEDHDTPQESARPEGDDGGYLWGMVAYWRFLERDGGTYVQSESVSLTRTVPAALAWFVIPFIKEIPRESLDAILKDTRKGVLHPPTP